MMMDENTKLYIKNHLNDDVFQLALDNKRTDIDIQLALRQISGYQILKRKVPAWTEFDNLLYPVHLSLEQCSSENTAKFKAKVISDLFSDKEYTLLDMTCGFGVDAYYISQNASSAILIEKDKELSEITKHNFEFFNRHAEVINCDAEEFLKTNSNKYDIVFIDPARRGKNGEKVVLLENCTPNILLMIPEIKKITNYLAIKLSPMFDIKQLLSQLHCVKNIYSIGVDNECKEIFVIIDFCTTDSNTKIVAVNISESDNEISIMQSDFFEEASIESVYPSDFGKYLYEPYASFLKSGLYKTIANRYDANKIDINSHLYTSNEIIKNFPGRKFEIVDIVEFNKKEAKRFFKKYEKANITVRNFPITADNLSNNYKVKNGGDNYVFATTIFPSKRVLINCKKI